MTLTWIEVSTTKVCINSYDLGLGIGNFKVPHFKLVANIWGYVCGFNLFHMQEEWSPFRQQWVKEESDFETSNVYAG